jgi:hypothetical protein
VKCHRQLQQEGLKSGYVPLTCREALQIYFILASCYIRLYINIRYSITHEDGREAETCRRLIENKK